MRCFRSSLIPFFWSFAFAAEETAYSRNAGRQAMLQVDATQGGEVRAEEIASGEYGSFLGNLQNSLEDVLRTGESYGENSLELEDVASSDEESSQVEVQELSSIPHPSIASTLLEVLQNSVSSALAAYKAGNESKPDGVEAKNEAEATGEAKGEGEGKGEGETKASEETNTEEHGAVDANSEYNVLKQFYSNEGKYNCKTGEVAEKGEFGNCQCPAQTFCYDKASMIKLVRLFANLYANAKGSEEQQNDIRKQMLQIYMYQKKQEQPLCPYINTNYKPDASAIQYHWKCETCYCVSIEESEKQRMVEKTYEELLQSGSALPERKKPMPTGTN